LGRGVRVVEQVAGSDLSVITNALWRLGPGFSPLIMAMGASSLAFGTARYVVMGEGGSEMLLLPTLIREATGLPSLPFQVAPGLANVSRRAMADLDLEGARVAYLLDDDASGRARATTLRQEGVPAKLIVSLGSKRVLEDMLDADKYLAAVNRTLKMRRDVEPGMPRAALPKLARPSTVDAWCDEHHLQRLSHTDVAMTLLEQNPSGPIGDPARRRQLRGLHDRLATALRLPALGAGV